MRAINDGVARGIGLGQAVGALPARVERRRTHDLSVMAAAARLGIPVTVHVAIGTDIIHMHPDASGAAHRRRQPARLPLLRDRTSRGWHGGVYLNCGSAVVLPEVFLKAVALARNRGIALDGSTTVNLDFVRLYRPQTNVVHRARSPASGEGYSLVGHHEMLIPLLAAALIEG